MNAVVTSSPPAPNPQSLHARRRCDAKSRFSSALRSSPLAFSPCSPTFCPCPKKSTRQLRCVTGRGSDRVASTTYGLAIRAVPYPCAGSENQTVLHAVLPHQKHSERQTRTARDELQTGTNGAE